MATRTRRPTKRESAEAARWKRTTAALGDPALFGDLYIAPYDPVWKNAGPLPYVARELAVWLTLVRRGVAFTPPEYLKSTVLQTYGLWLTARYAAAGKLDLLNGMYFSEEQGLAERNLSVISWHVENNAMLRRDFVDAAGRPLLEPDPEEDKWTDTEITLRRPGKVKDATWIAKGLRAQGIQGARLRHLLGDDVITPASAHSPAKQREALRLWDDQVTTRVQADGQAIVVGNFNSNRDVLSQLARRKSYAVLRRPSLYMPGDRSKAPEDPADPDAIEQLPERWPRERLQLEREEKPNRFARIHLLDESADVGEKLKIAWLQIIPPEDTPVAGARWIMALDPAPGGDDDDLDYFNVTVAALHGPADAGHLDIAISHDTRDSIGDQVELVAAYHDRFDRVGRGVQAIGIAKVALDRYFGGALAILRPDLRRKLVPIAIGQASKSERLEALGPYAKSGWLRAWEPAASELTSAEADKPQELSFVEQWTGFDNIAHDDKLDGADIAARTAVDFGYVTEKRTARIKPAGSRR